MIILLCTIANVCLLGGSIQAFRVARKQANAAAKHADNSANAADAANEHTSYAIGQAIEAAEHATKAEEHASNAAKHASIADQHAQTVGQISLLAKQTDIKMVDLTKPDHSDIGNNIGKRR
jgi:hypothetical protein